MFKLSEESCSFQFTVFGLMRTGIEHAMTYTEFETENILSKEIVALVFVIFQTLWNSYFAIFNFQ